jgi:cysteine synthase A
LYHYIKSGKLDRTDGSSITEGIGQGRITQNLQDAPIDESLFISDQDSVNMVC